jgi:hypothetical protein
VIKPYTGVGLICRTKERFHQVEFTLRYRPLTRYVDKRAQEGD